MRFLTLLSYAVYEVFLVHAVQRSAQEIAWRPWKIGTSSDDGCYLTYLPERPARFYVRLRHDKDSQNNISITACCEDATIAIDIFVLVVSKHYLRRKC